MERIWEGVFPPLPDLAGNPRLNIQALKELLDDAAAKNILPNVMVLRETLDYLAHRNSSKEARIEDYFKMPNRKPDLMQSVVMPGTKPVADHPFRDTISLQRITNAVDPSLKKAKWRTIDEFAYYHPGRL